MAVVRKIRSPKAMGEEWPLPGMGVFQAMLSELLQWRGRLASVLWPLSWGPRHMGHSSAIAGIEQSSSSRDSNRFMRHFIPTKMEFVRKERHDRSVPPVHGQPIWRSDQNAR